MVSNRRHHFSTPAASQERPEAEGVRVKGGETVAEFKRLCRNPAVELG